MVSSKIKIIVALFAIALLFGCTNTGSSTGNTVQTNNTVQTTNSPSMTGAQMNNSATTTQMMLVPSNGPANPGDTAFVDYTLVVDGKVIDTSNGTLANLSGIYNPQRVYQPLQTVLELNNGLLNGFVAHIIGMNVNETTTFTLTPDQGYGVYDPSKVMTVPKVYNMSLLQDVPVSYLTSRGINVTKGSALQSDIGMVIVNNISSDNTTATLYYMVSPGQNISFEGLPETVLSVDDNLTATFGINLGVNQTYTLTNPDTGENDTFMVTNMTDTNYTLDGNGPLAGKNLTFTVTLVGLETNVPMNSS